MLGGRKGGAGCCWKGDTLWFPSEVTSAYILKYVVGKQTQHSYPFIITLGSTIYHTFHLLAPSPRHYAHRNQIIRYDSSFQGEIFFASQVCITYFLFLFKKVSFSQSIITPAQNMLVISTFAHYNKRIIQPALSKLALLLKLVLAKVAHLDSFQDGGFGAGKSKIQ
jgi:hypothetical protein